MMASSVSVPVPRAEGSAAPAAPDAPAAAAASAQVAVPAADIYAPLPGDLDRLALGVGRIVREGAGEGAVGVAYSGGVDSAVLAALVARELGRAGCVLLMGVSPSLARRERRAARAQADALGLRLIEVTTREVEDPRYAANPVDRCYFCKSELFSRFDAEVVAREGITVLAYGENADDSRRPDRPGGQAARERGVLYPLSAAGATKGQVRAIAAAFGLASATKPAAPCLASRIPHGESVTPEKLDQIDRAEDVVLAAGFSDCRVRHHGTLARIEVPTDEVGRFADDDLRRRVLTGVRDCGFAHVTVDLAGLVSGMFTLSLLPTRTGTQTAPRTEGGHE